MVGSELHVRYLPVMVTRIMLSLKKAAASQGNQWSFGEPTTFTGMRFAGVLNRDVAGDSMALDTIRSEDREEDQKFGVMS